MKYLAIDTSGTHLSVVVFDGEKVHTKFDADCHLLHSVSLMPAVEEVLTTASVTIEGLDFIAVVIGAGSFTGIRIGVSTAKALGYAKNKPILGVTSFDALAYNIDSGKVLAVIDAKHGNYYVAGYEDKKLVVSPTFITFDELVKLSNEYTIISNDELSINYQKADLLNGLIKAVEDKKEQVTFEYEKVEPLYVRKSQAEEGR